MTTTPSDLDTNTYRSSMTGARIWRRELLSRRRDEFADLPDGIRSVYVTRVARSLSGLMLALGGALIVALSASPELAAWIESIAPGPRPAVATTLLCITWGLGALSYLAGWALGENRFTRAMLRAVKPTDDLHHDVQRLSNVSPGTVAVGMTRAWETASTVLPVLAVAALMPATLVYLAMASAAGGFVELGAYETALADGSRWLAGAAGLGLIATIIVSRLRRADLATVHARKNTLLAGLFLSAISAAAGISISAFTVAAVAGSLAVVTALGAWAASRIRKERLLIDCQADAAHAAVSLRARLRRLRTLVAEGRATIRERGLAAGLAAGLRAARARLALGRRLLALVKAPFAWSPGTFASIAAAGLIVAFTGWLGADALAQSDDGAHASTNQAAIPNAPWNNPDQTPDPVAPDNADVAPQGPASPVLYTAPPAGPGMAGTLLIIDFRKGLFAETELDIDLDHLPCGKIRRAAGWRTGTSQNVDGQILIAEYYAPGEPDALDITSKGAGAPLELRTADGIVFTPCMVAHGLDMDDLDKLADTDSLN